MTASFIDIGANLTNKAFRSDLDDVLRRAAGASLSAILVTGTSAAGSRYAREMVLDKVGCAPALYATSGIHPHHAKDASRVALEEIRELGHRDEIVAIGECGLDYERDLSPRASQRACLEAQLEIAAEVAKPLFFHERGAHEDFLAIVREHRSRIVGGVVHCFTGDRVAAERYLELDLHLGFTGWICDERRGTHLEAIVPLVPAGRLLIETDAPYILPRDMPSRPASRRNEPAFLPHIASVLARHRGETVEALACHSTEAARALFRLSVL